MKKNEILTIIIQRITENKNTYDDKFKDYYKVCHYIYTVSQNSGFPFVSMDGKIYVYTGTHLEEVDASCQSACKTSCGVANQKCENTNK